MTTIAVTGAAGFVGRHLVTRLLRDGIGVLALSRSRSGRRDVAEVVVADYGDTPALAARLAGVDAVVHLAARAHHTGAEPADAAALYEQANVGAALSMAQAARQAGVARFVLVSSIGVHGNATHGRPFSEADPPRPVEPYAASKWRAEQAVAAELATGATDFCVLRPPLVYGDGCKGNFARLLALVERAPLIPLGAVTARRSYIAVDNLVDAMLAAARHPGASRRSFVVADAQSLSLGELVRCLAAALGRSPHAVCNVPPSLLALAAAAVGRRATFDKLCAELLVDAGAFSRATGWTPGVAAAAGLAEMARAHRRRSQAAGRAAPATVSAAE